MSKRPFIPALALAALLTTRSSLADEIGTTPSDGESLVSSVCRLINSSALAEGLPVAFLTRLIWQESRFEADAVSPAGALGIAQFMPGTADDRRLKNPFDPESAIPKAAALLADLKAQFGNLGLAAAAYNAGPTRLANFLARNGQLPFETQDYVVIITGHSIEDWTGSGAAKPTEDEVFPDSSCVQDVAAISRSQPTLVATSPLFAPWGVQISGSFSKAAALRAYVRARAAYAAILGDIDPMIIGGILRSRGFRTFYRVRAPAPTREAAETLCSKLLRLGGACAVLRS
jgi:hypothetical protein